MPYSRPVSRASKYLVKKIMAYVTDKSCCRGRSKQFAVPRLFFYHGVASFGTAIYVVFEQLKNLKAQRERNRIVCCYSLWLKLAEIEMIFSMIID